MSALLFVGGQLPEGRLQDVGTATGCSHSAARRFRARGGYHSSSRGALFASSAFLVSLSRGRTRQGSAHIGRPKCVRHASISQLVPNTWYDKVGIPEKVDVAGTSENSQQSAMHLLQAHRDSFKHFLRHLFGKEMRKMSHDVHITPESEIFISMQEAERRGLTSQSSLLREVCPGVVATQLQDVLPTVHQGKRFTANLMTEKMYYVESHKSADLVQMEHGTYVATAFVPMLVSDSETGFNFTVHLNIGSFPMLTESASLIIGGNPYVIVHRLERSPGLYFSIEGAADKDDGVQHNMEIATEEYSRIRCRCSADPDTGELCVDYFMPKSNVAVPACMLLLALGVAPDQIKSARNGEILWMEEFTGGEEDAAWAASSAICSLLGVRTELFGGDPVAALSFKTSWSLSSRLGPLGRRRLNERLGLRLLEEQLTPTDLLGAADLIVDSFLGRVSLQVDDIDSLVNKRLRSIGQKMQGLVRDWLLLVQDRAGCFPVTVNASQGTAVVPKGSRFPSLQTFCVSQMWKENNRQLFDAVNPLSELVQARRISQVSELGLDKIKRIQGIRLIHPSHYGRICPIETGEGMSAGIVMAMASNTRVTTDGELEAPHQRVRQGSQLLLEPREYLLAQEQSACRVAQFDVAHAPDGALVAPARMEKGSEVASVASDMWTRPESVTMTHLGLFGSCSPDQVEYVACGAPISVAVGLIPFVEHDDANRALMGAKHQQQAVPTLWPERPIVGSGMEAQVAAYCGRSKHAGSDGHVLYADAANVTVVACKNIIQVEDRLHQLRQKLFDFYALHRHLRWFHTSQEAFCEMCMRLSFEDLHILYHDLVAEGSDEADKERTFQKWFSRARLAHTVGSSEAFVARQRPAQAEVPLPDGWIETGFCIETEMMHHQATDAASTKKHTLSHDAVVAKPYEAVCAGDIIAEGPGIFAGELALGKNVVVAYMPFDGYNYEDAIVISERCVREDILTSVHIEELVCELDEGQIPEADPELQVDYMSHGLAKEGTWLGPGDVAISLRKSDHGQYFEMRVPDQIQGRVIHSKIQTTELESAAGEWKEARVASVMIAVVCRIQVGDKLSGRHGNKGIVSRIVQDRDMPYLPDGTPIDICLNPLGVPSRMNVGQIFENILGSAGRWNGEEYRVGSFDEMFAEEASRGLVFEAMRRAQTTSGNKWLLDAASPGKTRVYDGKTGRPLDQPVTAGISYMIKLCHMIRDKIHARPTLSQGEKGRYHAITQQPVKGRSRGGGLRLGEMEVSALIGHGAPATLQELLTVKSDDLQGRIEMFHQLAEGGEIELPQGATPEGYLAFSRELAASGLVVVEGSWSDDDVS